MYDLYQDLNKEYAKHADVKNGAWVLIKQSIPVENKAKPVVYGIYWGVPHDDKYGRQCCRIRTTEDVVLLNHEYTVISEERLEAYKEAGWKLKETAAPEPIDTELLLKGRNLCEEEREVIWALQLDGLSEQQACEEYFFSKHADYNNYAISYIPTPEMISELKSTFGE